MKVTSSARSKSSSLVDALDAELAKALGGDELVEGDHVHVEGLGALGDELADAAEADHAQRLAIELVAAVARTRPFAADERPVCLGHVSKQRQGQRQRVLGRRDRVRLWRVGDDDSALGGGRDIDVVDACAGAADRLHAIGARDQLGGQLGRRADQDRVELADALGELAGIPIETELDVEALAQQLDAGSAIFSLTRTLASVRASVASPRVRVLDDPIDACRERL